MNAGFVVLSRDPFVRGEVMTAATHAGVPVTVAQTAGDLLHAAGTARAIILDRAAIAPEQPGSDDMLHQLAEAPERAARIVLVLRNTTDDPPPGADVLVVEPALGALLAALAPLARPAPHPVALDRLVAISVLSGPLDDALEAATAEVAASFEADRCVITVRGDATGGSMTRGGSHTWDSLTWNQTSDLCRVAAAAGASLVAPSPIHAARTESYVAVPLVPTLGAAHASHGFLGLVSSGARIFGREHRAALQTIAARLGSELGWRAVHERTADELDRAVHGPGLDPQLGIWNRTAMTQLATMHVSASVRTQLPLTAAVVDVVDLGGINTRHGLDTGDRVLRRIADALRANVRTEDVVGRWSGDKLAVLLPGTAIEGAQRVAERFRAAVAERPLELPAGGVLQIPATIGLAALAPPEEAAVLLARAARAASQPIASHGSAGARSTPGGSAESIASHGSAGARSTPGGSAESIDLAEDVRATLGGTYRLLHEISRGGMGVVYRGEDLALERPVAIKMLRPDLAEDRAFVEHLRGEAAMLARLEHPNLVQIYNFGQSGGDSYFVMELVEGEGLQQAIERHRLERTQMPLPELVAAIEQVASALDALHERGVIHRDVKPANVIRDPFRGRSVLVDVGIARRFGQFAESAGTPGYVAPEVIEGLEAGPPSDVYGLAATTYTLLTLAAPWGDGDSVLQRQTSDEEVPAPSLLRAELAPIDDLLRRSLARDPRQRPATAGAFARELRAALHALAPRTKLDGARWVASTVLPNRGAPLARTRGVVFRSVTRALGIRDAERLRDAIGGEHPDIARALTDTAPLAWLPTDLLVRLFAVAPTHVDRDGARLARDVGRAAVRASFRRFFPASAATLVPELTLSAIRNVWGRYQSWGTVASMPIGAAETVIRISDTPRRPELCVWTAGMLEQLVILSGGRGVAVDHEACEAREDHACLYRVMWGRPES